MSRKILEYPDPLLRKKTEEVKEVTPAVRKLCQEMIEAMLENQGVGLAAPQVGVLKRVIVALIGKKPLSLINPKIVKRSRETFLKEEGCLSFPGLFLKIRRAKKVEVEALSGTGQKIRLRVEGLDSRILQHEIDHLDGILLIDRLSFWQKLWRWLRN